jgi:hypothetical protein
MLKHLAIAALALSLFIKAFNYNREAIIAAPMEMPEVASQLVERIQPGTITARKPNIAWYLNLHFPHYPTFNFVALPNKDILNQIRKMPIDYLYLSPNEWFLRPELQPLFDPKKAPPFLKLVYYRPELSVVVYQIDHSDMTN